MRSQGLATRKHCAYCGADATLDDHVVPRALYPPSKHCSRVQRITVDACAYRDVHHARRQIARFMEDVYNRQWLHSALDYRPPVEFEADPPPAGAPSLPPPAVVHGGAAAMGALPPVPLPGPHPRACPGGSTGTSRAGPSCELTLKPPSPSNQRNPVSIYFSCRIDGVRFGSVRFFV
jgi:hypothetical protein